MTRCVVLATSLAALSASCASAPTAQNNGKPVPSPEPSAVASAPAPREPSPLVSVRAPDKLPANVLIDGNLAEWGSLLPPPEGNQPPAGAPSHLAFALTKDGAFVAAELAELSKDGIWLAFGFPPSTPASSSGVEAHEARFVRMFRLDKSGLFQVSESGALVPVPHSVTTMAFTPRAMTIEARIPVAAYPRASAAPIPGARVQVIAATTSTPPKIDGAKWIDVTAPEPVAFEPHAELRAAVYRQNLAERKPLGLSYSPADPGHIETVRHPGKDTSSVVTSESPLYVPQRTLGDVEIGYTSAVLPSVAVFKGGAFVDVIDVADIGEEPMGIVERNKQIHVFSYSQTNELDAAGFQAGWSVVAVAEDGSISYPFNAETGVGRWEKVYEIHSDKFDWFGMRGVPREYADEETPRAIEILWRFDKQFGGYMPTTRPLTTLPPPKPKPGKKP
ncbi:hypothetical protein [Polyangium jinanense]|uniref:Lipoprotein n=1 Tax=Polyangium jinanense TaxID=2829994 RepID=A0A9X3X2R4_9BACT|nr:hypothetical protein [Polyangium jinanense]MDC3955092.1 hypothetical protein [Polyangium jinanense]MDC3981138.1 hypothetical protein [Polyangium jinanense]